MPVSSTAQTRRCLPQSPVPTCAVATAPRGGNRRSLPSEPPSPPFFVFSDVLPLTGSTHLFGLCRSSPIESAQPNPVEAIRPSMPDPFLVAWNSARNARVQPVRPNPFEAQSPPWPSFLTRGPVPTRAT
ncbi:hypothetical protein CRG98_002967 [Punica granatum]|uniref:Uncharacterized protein n=1 Tax=Punica granatum TaxID=22663 RepID=A0A2I0L7H4_PUNGR|nr:hypothetical protein CRG98_002967 [Punica granatum]